MLSFGALLFSGALLVAVTVPASLFGTSTSSLAASSKVSVIDGTQTMSVNEVASSAPPISRDSYAVISYSDLLALNNGLQQANYPVYNYGPVRWPFPYPVPISSGYGSRPSPCRGCSSFHHGDDFVPGAGAPIYAIADGVVSLHVADDWSYGNNIEIQHVIDGQKITSKYAHMQLGSSPLKVGDIVKVGDFIGLVGSTGEATGPHLHFEIHVDGVPVNPFPWLLDHNKK
jgi:murein DD-endopeptidase MepM/ murein hydrolase activator NlpD